jgi:hypothetical protein
VVSASLLIRGLCSRAPRSAQTGHNSQSPRNVVPQTWQARLALVFTAWLAFRRNQCSLLRLDLSVGSRTNHQGIRMKP